MSYRALQLAEPGAIANFRMVTLPLKQPTGPGSVQVKVQACAVAYRDVLDRQGAFKFIRRPTVLGHEFAGTVTAVGDGPSRWRVGDRVCSLHWDQAAAWPSPLNATGAVDSMFGLTCDGGYAEYCNARTGALVKAPPFLNSSEAASVMSTFGTVWNGAVVRGGLASGQTLLVTGASGGVGSSAVMLGAAMGNRVIAVTTSAAKVPFLTGIGAASVIVADSKGAFKPPAERVDMVLEAVGGPTFKSSLRSVSPRRLACPRGERDQRHRRPATGLHHLEQHQGCRVGQYCGIRLRKWADAVHGEASTETCGTEGVRACRRGGSPRAIGAAWRIGPPCAANRQRMVRDTVRHDLGEREWKEETHHVRTVCVLDIE
jgi:NADPH:quinone reductase-like Zn-dependent oxidoreductase